MLGKIIVHSGLGKVISKPLHINYKIWVWLGPRVFTWGRRYKQEWETLKNNFDVRLTNKATLLYITT